MTIATGEVVAIGALVTVEEDDAERRFFVAPHGGGLELAGGIAVVTPAANRTRTARAASRRRVRGPGRRPQADVGDRVIG